ncbi:MAG: hypothetical protein AAGG01_08980 [Planctomycetota bacterium]
MLQLVLCALMGASASAVPGEPFPSKTTTVKTDDSQFNVAGRHVLPRNAKVALLRRAKVLGTSAAGEDGKTEDAVLEVSGTLELKAVTGGKVELRNVWIELTPECKSLYLADVRFIGGGGIRASSKGPSTADVFMEKVEFVEGASFSMSCAAGTITVTSTHSKGPVKLLGASRSERAESKAKIRVTGCKGGKPGSWRGMMGGLEVSGAKFALVQFCHLEGGTSRFADNGKLSFEGNNVRSQFTEFAYSRSGQFKRATISGCDFRSKEVAFLAPPNDGKTEKLSVKDCYFTAGTDGEAILKEQIRDARRSDETSAEVSLKKIKERPIGLGGSAGR